MFYKYIVINKNVKMAKKYNTKQWLKKAITKYYMYNIYFSKWTQNTAYCPFKFKWFYLLAKSYYVLFECILINSKKVYILIIICLFLSSYIKKLYLKVFLHKEINISLL